MFRLRSFVFVLFAIFFFSFNLNTLAQGMMPVDIASAASSASPSSAKSDEPPTDPRETQMESASWNINWAEERISDYNNSIQEVLADVDSINEQVHGLDSEAEDFQEKFSELNKRINDDNDNVEYYKACINAKRDEIAELTDRLDKLRKDIDENPFRPQLEVITATPAPQPSAPSSK